MVIVVLCPSVELPSHQTNWIARGGCGLVFDDECRTGISEPDPIGGCLEKANRIKIDAHGVEMLGHPVFHPATSNDDMHALRAAEITDDLGVNPGNRLKLARPVVAVMWPRDPGRLMRFPFGGHPILKQRGKLVHRRRWAREQSHLSVFLDRGSRSVIGA